MCSVTLPSLSFDSLLIWQKWINEPLNVKCFDDIKLHCVNLFAAHISNLSTATFSRSTILMPEFPALQAEVWLHLSWVPRSRLCFLDINLEVIVFTSVGKALSVSREIKQGLCWSRKCYVVEVRLVDGKKKRKKTWRNLGGSALLKNVDYFKTNLFKVTQYMYSEIHFPVTINKQRKSINSMNINVNSVGTWFAMTRSQWTF